MKSFFILLLMVPLVFIFNSCSNDSSSNADSGQSIVIKEKQHRQGLDLFLLIDESGSMIGQNGTDPSGIRFDASRYLLQNLFVKRADDEYPNRVSVIHFGDEAKSSGLIDVLPGNITRIQDYISSNTSPGANTNILAALKNVKADFERAIKYGNRRDRAIVIFTDGKPELGNNESEFLIDSHFKEIQEYLKKELGDFKLFIIGIDNPAAVVKFTQTVSKWKGFLNDENINAIKNLDELYSGFNKAVENILEIKTYETLIKDSGEFQVNPYVDELEFHIFTRNPLKLSIHDPNNKLIRIDTAQLNNGYIIHKETNPAPGSWKYTLQKQPGDNTPIRIVKNEIPFKLELLTPEPIFNGYGQRYFPLGKRVRLKARFTRENHTEIKELPEYPLSFTARINSQDNPGFDKQIRFLNENKAGLNYYADETIAFDKEGKYNIRLSVKGGTAVEFIQTEPIEIVKIPYFEAIEPLPLDVIGSGDAITIKGQYKLAGKRIEPGKFFIDNPSNIVLSQVVNSPDSLKSAAIWLEEIKGDTLIVGKLPIKDEKFNTLKEGIYELAFDFKTKPTVQYRLFPERVLSVIDIKSEEGFFFILWKYIKWIGGVFLGLLLAGAMYKLFKFFIRGKNANPLGKSITALVNYEYDESEESFSSQPEEVQQSADLQQTAHGNEPVTILDGNSTVKNFTRPVVVELGKNKKKKPISAKLWARPLDEECNSVEIYSGNLLSNLLIWKKPLAVLDGNSNSSSISVKKKTVEVIFSVPPSDFPGFDTRTNDNSRSQGDTQTQSTFSF